MNISPEITPANLQTMSQLRYFNPSRLVQRLTDLHKEGIFTFDFLRGSFGQLEPYDTDIARAESAAFYSLTLNGDNVIRAGSATFVTGRQTTPGKEYFESLELITGDNIRISNDSRGLVSASKLDSIPASTIKVWLTSPSEDNLVSQRYDRVRVFSSWGWRRSKFILPLLPTADMVAEQYLGKLQETVNSYSQPNPFLPKNTEKETSKL